MMKNNKILIIGGTGSLGNELTKRYLHSNDLWLYSRDESKHWAMEIDYKYHPNLNFIIGDISDSSKINQTLIRHNFDIIILAAALKHIDRCEYETNECLKTNFIGTKNVLDCIENSLKLLPNLKCVCFISTDKACSPVNFYGMMKAASESLMIEKSKFIPSIKFVCTRYGNVLNSRGSIIPMLHKIGNDNNISEFKLTHPNMTRFVMTLSQSVDLIEHAIIHGESGDIVIPKLISCKVKDLIELFSEIYNKPVKVGQLRLGEKMLESLINETQSLRTISDNFEYTFIKPCYKNFQNNNNPKDYNSTINPLDKISLKEYLLNLDLL
jgi:UDP-glucose 4-epimerase